MKEHLRPAVFLDRDGVINQTHFRDGKERAPDRLADFKYFHGVAESIQALKSAGFVTVVVTNQPDVARGWQTRDVVEAMNQKVLEELAVDLIKVCYHDHGDGCACRKPRPGMLIEAIRELSLDPARSFMIGDRYGDLAAGHAAGCTSILVGPGDASVWNDGPLPIPATKVASLAEATAWILNLK